jgi:GntR family transcriptional regulator
MGSVTTIQRDDAIPLYHQIFLALRDDILSGALPYGAAVPTERDLTQRFGVSRITARRAMQALAEAGLVERRRRIGTRVIHRARPLGIEVTPEHAVDSLIAFGRDTKVELLDFRIGPAGADIAAALEVGEDSEVIHAVRRRFLRGEPIGVIESQVPVAFGAGLTAQRLATTPLLELLRNAGHAIGDGQQLISAIAAGPALAAQLQIEPRAPIIRIERISRDLSGRCISRTAAHYRGDRYRLALDMRAVPHPLTG